MGMKIFKVERTDHIDYDEYDSVIVVAADEQQARETHPRCGNEWDSEDECWTDGASGWTYDISSLEVEFLGNYLSQVGPDRPGPIMGSFNAG